MASIPRNTWSFQISDKKSRMFVVCGRFSGVVKTVTWGFNRAVVEKAVQALK
jgi:hypothetical protein